MAFQSRRIISNRCLVLFGYTKQICLLLFCGCNKKGKVSQSQYLHTNRMRLTCIVRTRPFLWVGLVYSKITNGFWVSDLLLPPSLYVTNQKREKKEREANSGNIVQDILGEITILAFHGWVQVIPTSGLF